MNAYLPPSARRGFRIAGLIAAIICVLAIAAGAFVVSYTGVRDMALTAGVAAHYARFYPWIFDAVFVVAAVAALSLRGALRAYAWLAILVILGAVATADAIHAMSIAWPKRPTEATVAVAPWAVLLIGFTLLYAMARQGSLPVRRAAAADPTSNGRAGNGMQATQVPLSALLTDQPATRPERARAALTAQAATATVTRPDPVTRTAPVPPKSEPITTKSEPIAPEPGAPETEALTPKVEPTAPKMEPVAPKTEPPSTKRAVAELVATEPVTVTRTESATAKPVAAEPVLTEPVAETEPATAKLVPAEPVAAEPVTVAGTEPTSTKPTVTEPVTAQPVAEPVTSQPVTSEPVAVTGTEPTSTKPTVTEPVTAQPVAEPVTSQPVTSQLVTGTRSEPIATEQTSAELAETGLVSDETEPVSPAAPTAPERAVSTADPYPVSAADPYPASSADSYPARTQQFAGSHPPAVARSFFEPGRPFTEPELSARQPTERDDPSDADAEPVEPSMHFNRLRSGPTPPEED